MGFKFILLFIGSYSKHIHTDRPTHAHKYMHTYIHTSTPRHRIISYIHTHTHTHTHTDAYIQSYTQTYILIKPALVFITLHQRISSRHDGRYTEYSEYILNTT